MKLIQQASLWFSEGSSDKIYEVDLCEIGNGQFVVNFRYGRRGTTLRDGTKTTLPVAEAQARKIYDQLVGSKVKEGYQSAGSTAPIAAPTVNSSIPRTDRSGYLLGLLQNALPSGKLPATAKWSLGRLIWRIGELQLREAVPGLLALIPKSDDLQQYCLIWALGRCGDEAAIPTLERLHTAPASSEKVKRMALVSWLALAKGAGRQVIIQRQLDGLPADLRTLVTAGKEHDIIQYLHHQFSQQLSYDVLESLYLLAEEYPFLHTVVGEVLRTIPIRAHKPGVPSTFRNLRHLFKIAEFREDAEIFGLLAYRFEKTPELFRRSPWSDYAQVDGEWYNDAKREMAKKESKLAYSNKTRTYLRQRVWRTLRTLGKDGQEAYVAMATGVLLAFSDETDYTEPKKVQYEWYEWSSRTSHARVTHYDAYANYGVFYHILYENSSRYEGKKNNRAWRCREGYQPGQPAPAGREEAFPLLWDQHPEALLALLMHSRVERVHEFAVKALRANPRLSEIITLDFAIELINKPYSVTVRLGVEQLRQLYNPDQPNLEVIATLIRHSLPEARQLAREWLNANPAYFIRRPTVLAAVLVNPYHDVREWVGSWLTQNPLNPEEAKTVIVYVIAHLLALPVDEENSVPAAESAARILLEYWAEPLRTIGLEVVQDLLRHPLAPVQILGAGILLRHQISPQDLPPSVLESLIQATTPEVRQAGVQLFGKLPTDRLLASQDVLLAFCVSTYPEIRQAVRPIIRNLSAHHAAFGQQIIRKVVAIIQTQEPFEGLHEDLFQLIAGELVTFLSQIDQETSLQLLHSRRAVNQRLGNLLLQKVIPDSALSIREVVKLAGHEMREVRQRAVQFYEANRDRIKAEPEEALRILDVDWEDSRQFAFGYFRQTFTADDWTPALLVSVCDSTRDDVRQFGRELITRYFREENGTDYLLKLSKHPSPDLQLFATNYLQQFAAGKPENIQQLVPYFTTVLSQVNRAGVAKARVLAFLKNEALQNETVAQLVAKLLTRQSLTIAVADKAACLQLMRDIRKAYPHLDLPLSLKPVAAYIKPH